MGSKLSEQGILELLENGEVSEIDISDEEVETVVDGDDLLIEDFSDLSEQFDGYNFDNFDTDNIMVIDTLDNVEIVDTPLLIFPPSNEFPITQKKKYKMVTTTISMSNHNITRSRNTSSGRLFT